MKKNKTRLIPLFLLLSLFIIGSAKTIEGSTLPFLYVSPSSAQKNTGEIINVSIRVNPSGKNVCLVEGRVAFNNLSCQSITLAEDVMVQSSPSCANPYFLIGIPGCTLTDKNIFNISVKMGSAGKGTISFTNVDVVGEGVSISNNSVGGDYNIMSAVPPVSPVTEQPITTEKREEAVVEKSIIEEEETTGEEEIAETTTERKSFVFEAEELLMLSSASLALATIGESPTLTTIFVLCLVVLSLVGAREAFILIEKKKFKQQ